MTDLWKIELPVRELDWSAREYLERSLGIAFLRLRSPEPSTLGHRTRTFPNGSLTVRVVRSTLDAEEPTYSIRCSYTDGSQEREGVPAVVRDSSEAVRTACTRVARQLPFVAEPFEQDDERAALNAMHRVANLAALELVRSAKAWSGFDTEDLAVMPELALGIDTRGEEVVTGVSRYDSRYDSASDWESATWESRAPSRLGRSERRLVVVAVGTALLSALVAWFTN